MRLSRLLAQTQIVPDVRKAAGIVKSSGCLAVSCATLVQRSQRRAHAINDAQIRKVAFLQKIAYASTLTVL